MLPSPSFWQSESSMQLLSVPLPSALLLLPEAADETAREAAATTARHASVDGDHRCCCRSMTAADGEHSLW